MVVVAAKVTWMGWLLGWWFNSGIGGLMQWLDFLLKKFGSILGGCTKWLLFALLFMIKYS